jgi:hypothetical protein
MDALKSFANLNPATKVAMKLAGQDTTPSPEKFGKVGASILGNDSTVNQIINYAILAFALYLAFKCKKDGKINFVQLIIALCCSPCYVIYRLIKPCDKY